MKERSTTVNSNWNRTACPVSPTNIQVLVDSLDSTRLAKYRMSKQEVLAVRGLLREGGRDDMRLWMVRSMLWVGVWVGG